MTKDRIWLGGGFEELHLREAYIRKHWWRWITSDGRSQLKSIAEERRRLREAMAHLDQQRVKNGQDMFCKNCKKRDILMMKVGLMCNWCGCREFVSK